MFTFVGIHTYMRYEVIQLSSVYYINRYCVLGQDDAEKKQQVWRGNPHYQFQRNAKIVRIFTSSTFTGT